VLYYVRMFSDIMNITTLKVMLPSIIVHNSTKLHKKLSYRKETVRLHNRPIASSSAVAEKKHCRVGQFWVGDVHMKVSIHTASHIDTRLAVARVSRVRLRVRVRVRLS